MINKARTMHNLNRSSETIIINSEIVPVVDAISDLLGIKNLRINGRQYKKLRKRKFYEDNIDLIASFGAILGIDKIDKATKEYIIKNKLTPKLIAQPEGAMIAIDTTSGAIRAMVGEVDTLKTMNLIEPHKQKFSLEVHSKHYILQPQLI